MNPLNFYKSTSTGLCKKVVSDLSMVDLIVFTRRLCSVFGLHLPLKCVVAGHVEEAVSTHSFNECINYLNTIKNSLPRTDEELSSLFYKKFCGSINFIYYQESLAEWKRVFALIENLLADGYYLLEVPADDIVSMRSSEIMHYLLQCWNPSFDLYAYINSVYCKVE